MTRQIFAKATSPPQVTASRLQFLPIALSIVNAVMALAQLATFEDFVLIIDSYDLANGAGATALALAITALEILSLPVLLRFRLSPAMRMVSAAATVLAPLAWLQLNTWITIYGFQLVNAGFFGEILPVPTGWWVFVGGLLYFGLSLYTLKILGGDKLLSR